MFVLSNEMNADKRIGFTKLDKKKVHGIISLLTVSQVSGKNLTYYRNFSRGHPTDILETELTGFQSWFFR